MSNKNAPVSNIVIGDTYTLKGKVYVLLSEDIETIDYDGKVKIEIIEKKEDYNQEENKSRGDQIIGELLEGEHKGEYVYFFTAERNDQANGYTITKGGRRSKRKSRKMKKGKRMTRRR